MTARSIKKKNENILEYLERIFESLTPTQKALANHLLGHFDEAAFQNADEMAEKIDTSASTVVRFAKDIGFSGFPDLKTHLRNLLIEKVSTIGQFQYAQNISVKGDDEVIHASFKKDIANLNKLYEMKNDEEIRKFVQIFSSADKKYIVAARSLFSLGHFFFFQTRKILPGVAFIHNCDGGIFDLLNELSPDDVVVAFSFPRYNSATINFSTIARERKVPVISITDTKISPLYPISEVTLFCPHESSSFFTSAAASMVLVNAIISELFYQNYHSAMKNLELDETLLLQLNILGTKGRVSRKKLWRTVGRAC